MGDYSEECCVYSEHDGRPRQLFHESRQKPRLMRVKGRSIVIVGPSGDGRGWLPQCSGDSCLQLGWFRFRARVTPAQALTLDSTFWSAAARRRFCVDRHSTLKSWGKIEGHHPLECGAFRRLWVERHSTSKAATSRSTPKSGLISRDAIPYSLLDSRQVAIALLATSTAECRCYLPLRPRRKY